MERYPSIAGYAEKAHKLVPQYESSPFAEVFEQVLDLFPSTPCLVLDIGAGSGRDAAALAKRGHTVVAVEPVAQMREQGTAFGNAGFTWLDDLLPALPTLTGKYAGPYDFILSAAVWMHFDQEERDASMRRVAELLAPGGRFLLTLRHGPIPEGRRMFNVQPAEITTLAQKYGLQHLTDVQRTDLHGRPEISWSIVCLEKPKHG